MLRFLLLAALVAACAPGPREVLIQPPDRIGVQYGVRLGWAIKRVSTKQPPDTVVAEDGTVCRLAPDRHAETQVGGHLDCDWQPREPPADSGSEQPEQLCGGACGSTDQAG